MQFIKHLLTCWSSSEINEQVDNNQITYKKPMHIVKFIRHQLMKVNFYQTSIFQVILFSIDNQQFYSLIATGFTYLDDKFIKIMKSKVFKKCMVYRIFNITDSSLLYTNECVITSRIYKIDLDFEYTD